MRRRVAGPCLSIIGHLLPGLVCLAVCANWLSLLVALWCLCGYPAEAAATFKKAVRRERRRAGQRRRKKAQRQRRQLSRAIAKASGTAPLLLQGTKNRSHLCRASKRRRQSAQRRRKRRICALAKANIGEPPKSDSIVLWWHSASLEILRGACVSAGLDAETWSRAECFCALSTVQPRNFLTWSWLHTAAMLDNEGKLSLSLRRYSAALDFHARAISLSLDSGLPDSCLAGYVSNIAKAFYASGEHELALEAGQRSAQVGEAERRG